MTEITESARLSRAIENQAAVGEACFQLPMDEARAICDEVEDELARLAWAAGVPVPRDADGNAVPLDTTELYTDKGEIVYVNSIRFNGITWFVGSENSYKLRWLNTLHRTEPDSWALLEKDVKRFEDYRDACAYYDRLLDDCDGCPGNEPDCDYFVARDVMRRTKALAGREANGTEQ